MRYRIFQGLLLAALVLCAGQSRAQVQENGVAGLWLTENNRSVIRVEPCGEKLCGFVHWIIEGGMQYDSKNPDPLKREIPMCNLKIFWDAEQDGPSEWEDGTIYKADDGAFYDVDLELLKDGRLKVRGYKGFSFLGKTQHWTRVQEREHPRCVEPVAAAPLGK